MKHLHLIARLICLVNLLFLSFIPVSAQTGVLNPNDPIVTYNPSAPPATPPNGVLSKWVITRRVSWNTSSFKAYYYNGLAFRLKFPKSYQPGNGKTYPLYLFFHGVGERGSIYDNEYQLFHGGQVHMNAVDNGTFDGFLLYPQTSNTSGVWSLAQVNVMASLITNYLIPQVAVDPNRIIVNGLSSGGSATWMFVEFNSKLAAGAVPMSAVAPKDTNYIPTLLFNPIWLSTGALDGSPSPSTAKQVVQIYQKAGADLKYKLYTTLGHGVWDSVWKEPDYFPFLNRVHKANPWPLYGENQYCPGSSISVTLGVTPGFDGYQWRKDGVVIPGATTNKMQAIAAGTYDCRILRGSVWSVWSPIPVIIKSAITATPTIQVNGLASKVIPAPDGSTSVTLQATGGYASYTWQKVGSTTTVGTSQLYTTSTPGSYIVQVKSTQGCTSSFSSPFIVVNANGPNKPDPATNLTVTPVSMSQLKLTWLNNLTPVYNETNFEIYQATTSGGPYKLVAITGADVLTYTAGGLTAGTRYYYIIRAVNNTGASANTAEVSGVTASDITPPSIPAGLTLLGSTRSSVSIKWNASTDNVKVTGYNVYINGVIATTTTATSYTANNLQTGTKYSFTIKAKDAAGNLSAASNILQALALQRGLSYKYYQGQWSVLPNFSQLTPVKTGMSLNVSIAPRNQDDYFGFLWEGFIWIRTAGTYTFRTNSDDGSRLYLGALNGTTSPYNAAATPLVDNDGLHGAQDRDGTISLQAGVYPIAIGFFESGGDQVMNVLWRTPQTGTSFVAIPDSVFADPLTLTSKIAAITINSSVNNSPNIVLSGQAFGLNGKKPLLYAGPDPFYDHVTVEMNFTKAQKNVSLQLVNATGHVVQKWAYDYLPEGQSNKTLQLSSLPKGIYYIRLLSAGSNQSATVKLLKQ